MGFNSGFKGLRYLRTENKEPSRKEGSDKGILLHNSYSILVQRFCGTYVI